MTQPYEIEASEPSMSSCDCCGGLTVSLTRFVYRHGDAFAIYYARYSNNHADNEISWLVSLGEWGEESDPRQRTAFSCRVRPTQEAYAAMLDDAGSSPWRDVDLVGAKLSREEALLHPLKSVAFEILDAGFLQDRSLRAFLERVSCGDTAQPLERRFQAPDDLWFLGERMADRGQVSQDFATLDGSRFFVRGLLNIPVDGYGTWTVGLWVEVSQPSFDRVKASWNDPTTYPHLRFEGTIANDLSADLDLPIFAGTAVQLHVPNSDSPPSIEAPSTGALSTLLSNPWAKAAFEQYAVARSFL